MRLSLVIYNANIDDDDVIAVVLKSHIVNSPFSNYLVTGPLWKLLKRNLDVK